MEYRFKKTGEIYKPEGGIVEVPVPEYNRLVRFSITATDFLNFFEPVHDFREGMWVKHDDADGIWFKDHPTQIFRVKKINDKSLYVYPDFWNSSNEAHLEISNFVPATESGIRAHLRVEAGMRGFVEGAKYKARNSAGDWMGIRTVEGNINSFCYSPDRNCLIDGRYIIYDNGVWGDVLKPSKKVLIDWRWYTINKSPRTITIGEDNYRNYDDSDLRQMVSQMHALSLDAVKIGGVELRRNNIITMLEALDDEKD